MTTSKSGLRRRAGAALAAAVAATTIAATAAPSAVAATPITRSAAAGAAGWLARQLAGPNHDHAVAFGAAQAGLTSDTILGMDAAGVAQRAATRATKWLRAHAKSYARGSGAAGTYDPGALAKLLLVAEAQRADVHHFGGLNLVKVLRGEEQPNGAYSRAGDSTSQSPVSQSLALIALSHTGAVRDWPNAKAIGWLTGQQCGDGGFVFSVQAKPSKTCADVDSTGYAAQALLTVHSSRAARALSWLRAHHNSDGGFGLQFNSTKPASNANSTAVAVQALLQAGSHVRSAIGWLKKHQIRCDGHPARRGAVTFDASGWNRDSAFFATAQAAQALGRRWLGDISKAHATAAAPLLHC